jgi:two-component system OmpR family sensor kinase
MPPRPFSSLRARLALWYLLVLGAILALFSAGIYLEVRGSLLGGVDAALQARADAIASQVTIGTGGVQYQGVDSPIAEAETAVYLFDASGRLRDAVAGSTELPAQPGLVGRALRGRDGYWATLHGQRVYTIALRDDSGQGSYIAGAVQVMQSLDAVNEQLQGLLMTLLLALPVLLLVATVGGVFLAGRALAPIDRITRTARAIGAGNLAGRLGPMPLTDEVGRLAATFDGMLDRLESAFLAQERAAAQQRQFTADASHELRTPLTIIKCDLDVLLRRQRTPAEYEEAVRDVNDEVARVSRLVEDLLTLARADSGQAEVAREFIYLDALVAEIAAGPRRLAETRGVAMETRLEQGVPLVGDSARLRQLVLNLLGNAVSYTPAGGRIMVALTADDGWARLEVADTGIGIAPEDLPHVFDRFFRADEARSHSEGGTGLGLAIARWCAEAHGGRIEARSQLGTGSVFTVLLPLAPTDDGAEQGSGRRAAPAGTGSREA